MTTKHLEEAKAKYGKDISWAIQVGYEAAIKDLNTRKSDFIDKLNETRKKYEQASHKVPTNVLVAAWRDRAKNLSQYPDNSGACAIYRVCARELETALVTPNGQPK